jgi:serine/threonine protein kinase
VDFIEDGGSGAIQDSSAYDSLIGRTIANNFRLVKRIGAGAMGRVYQAEQLSLGKMVAIKILRHELMADDKLLRRFELEARTASAVSHPNLVETFDCGRDLKLDLAYIAMELLHGPDLALVISREAPLDLQRSARIMDQVLAALEEAHAAGIVHRDLKPGNIMLVPRRDDPEFVKVCDFGIAKIKSARARPSLTMAGLVFGTPEYMSPEQACGEDVDARTDLYAVAAILYQLVSGQLPFPAPSPTEVLARILRDEPERPSQRGYVAVPEAIENLILRGMSKDREARPQTAVEFRVALRDAWSGVMDYWPGQSTALPTLSLHAVTSLPVTPSTPIARGPSGERPLVTARGPSGERPVVTPTPPAATPAAPSPPSRIINWNVLARRRPGRAAVLGFFLSIVCGGLGIWALTTRHGPSPAHEAIAPGAATASGRVTPHAPATQGIIVVPSPPRATSRSGNGDERHAAVASRSSPAAVRHDPPARVQKPVARGKQAHHDAESRGSAVAAANGAASRASSEAPEPFEPGPVEAPAAAESAPAKSGAGIAHKLRATSIPSEAEVLLDGKLIGRTPLFGAEVDVSQSHTLTIRKDGYAPYEQPVSSTSAWVTRPSDSAAALRIQTVLQKLDHVALAAAKANDGPSGPVVASSSAALAASSHKLRITSIPTDAEVVLDGKSVGRTPLFGADIEMSHSHRVVLRKDGYALFEQTITTSSDWVVKPSDHSSALLRISALLRRSDAALAQNPAAATAP